MPKPAPAVPRAKTPVPSSVKTPSGSGASAISAVIIEADNVQDATRYAQQLLDGRETIATQAARVVSEVAVHKPQLLTQAVDAVCTAVLSKNARVVHAAADALPALARLAPARVARHLDELTQAFGSLSANGKDGLVRTFAALCAASVAYQKRLETVLGQALNEADAKTLQRWVETVLPALKGEPHARARAVVEERLPNLPRAFAQKIAAFLGVKLRPIPRA